uniref:Uncharacterized protein n=1 Tax=Ananas comosus var. bracteatus TaxID=296719 RepID=A0A6V7NJ20_ANACO|nr:unnamed protein product [Ananas comosus var. bracteatus]
MRRLKTGAKKTKVQAKEEEKRRRRNLVKKEEKSHRVESISRPAIMMKRLRQLVKRASDYASYRIVRITHSEAAEGAIVKANNGPPHGILVHSSAQTFRSRGDFGAPGVLTILTINYRPSLEQVAKGLVVGTRGPKFES